VVVRGLSPTPTQRWADMHALVEAMHLDRTRRRRRLLAVAFAIPLLSAAVAAGALALRPEPTQADVDLTEQLATEARAAAAKGFFVHPPVDDPEHPTAFAKVLELEAMEGSIGEPVAGELRDEMATTLVRLGDTYYEKPGGPPFAADFYAMALVFDPSNERAAARATVTPGELAALRSKAESGSFSETELVAAEPLTVLADADTEARRGKVAKMRKRKVAASASTQARLEKLLGPELDETKAAIEPARHVADVVAPPREGVREESKAAPDPERAVASTPTDPKAAKLAASDGRKAFAGGRFDEAERHYHRALQHDRRCLPALEGLTDLHFERSQYDKAVGFARRATTLAPRKSGLQIKLGDAYFKVYRYAEARQAYERARELGSKAAKSRLERLSSKVSG
jgi:tetratricopeptide (TPR) repeat protein